MVRTLKAKMLSLPFQMVAGVVILVILTAGAIGLPVIALLRGQLDQQVWAIASQAGQTEIALLKAYESDLTNLAILTAQRPTLHELLETGGEADLQEYLLRLQRGAALDAIHLCEAGGRVYASTFNGPSDVFCQSEAQGIIPYMGEAGQRQAWLTASYPLEQGSTDMFVVASLLIDDEFARLLQEQTGVEQILLLNGEYISSSLAEGALAWQALAPTLESRQDDLAKTSFSHHGTPYYGLRLPYAAGAFEFFLAIPVKDLAAAQQRLTWTIAGGILLVIIASSTLGYFLARRISQPLERLRKAAVALQMGDLQTPVNVKSKVRQISQVAFALEDARAALQHSMAAIQHEKEWTDHLLESVVEGIVTIDRGGRITFFSQGAERISGWKQAEVLGKKLDEVFRLREANETFSQKMPATGRKLSILTRSAEDKPLTLAVTGAKLGPPEAGRAGTAFVFRDVSDEDAMRRLLGEFLANITHEFRTPLSALSASIELLMDQLPALSQAELEELLQSLHLGILGLQTLIDNLLEAASIEAGNFRVFPRTVNLAEIFRETQAVMQPLLEKYGLRLRVALPEDLPEIQADPRRTGQVLVNLLSNAIKWSPTGGEIFLGVKDQGGHLLVEVADEGPGVPQAERGGLFSRFVQNRSSHHRAEYGAGIGLSVVKAIVEAQEGNVGVNEREGGGALFWFTLPMALEQPV